MSRRIPRVPLHWSRLFGLVCLRLRGRSTSCCTSFASIGWDILDIPISFITERYLEYLGLMQSLQIDVAAEFLVMAATLAHLKSQLLLPREERQGQDTEAEEEGDPRQALVRAVCWNIRNTERQPSVWASEPCSAAMSSCAHLSWNRCQMRR